MAKYGKAASKSVKSAMHRKKRGTLKSGSGRRVKSRKQAIAIGLSEARKKGAKVPPRLSGRRSRRTEEEVLEAERLRAASRPGSICESQASLYESAPGRMAGIPVC